MIINEKHQVFKVDSLPMQRPKLFFGQPNTWLKVINSDLEFIRILPWKLSLYDAMMKMKKNMMKKYQDQNISLPDFKESVFLKSSSGK